MRRSVLLPVFLLVLSATVAPAATATTWWEDAVVYEVFVRSFHDSDGDGIGDFRGLEEKLGRGDYAFFDAGPGILAFERTHGGRSVVVIMNLSDEPRPVDARLLSGRYTDLLSSQSTTVADRFVMPPGKLSVLASARATR